jgi:hypothetical protein
MAIITRWRMPPRELVRIVERAPLGRRHAHPAQHLDRLCTRVRGGNLAVAQDRLGNLVADGERGVQRSHRLLEDHCELVAAQVAQALRRALQQVFALEQHLAVGDAPRRLGHEAHDRERGHALAASGFADDAERAAALEPEIDAVHRAHLAVLGVEQRPQPANFKERGRGIFILGDAVLDLLAIERAPRLRLARAQRMNGTKRSCAFW